MCTAIYANQTLARTVDRQGSIAEHRVIGLEHFIGGVIVTDDRKIWIDGINDAGLMIALLNYRRELTRESTDCGKAERTRLHPGEVIPAVLSRCTDTAQAAAYLGSVSLTEDAPVMFPHFILGDRNGHCIVFENGKILENPLGVLANAPSLCEITASLPDLSAPHPDIVWNMSSESRFARAAWLRSHCRSADTDTAFMNILDAVSVPVGADERPGYRTLVRAVLSANRGTYAFSTEENRTIRCIQFGQTGEFRLN
ncbi:MAG: linear amide C-N hydrolase [Clostridia bacterium]|nr:linear amide C-N hydrolase [Clostridia bacterium]